jgi:hypothetical protein
MRTPTRLALGLLAVTGLLVTGCSDDDGGDGASAEVSAEAQPYVDAMKVSMANSQDESDPFNLSEGQIDCMAPRMINAVGVDRLEEAGVTPEDIENDTDSMDFSDLDLSEDDGNAIYDAFGACDINLRDVMMESFASEDVPAEAQECIEGVLTDDNLRTFIVSMMVNGEDGMESDPAMEGFMSELMECAMAGAGG